MLKNLLAAPRRFFFVCLISLALLLAQMQPTRAEGGKENWPATFEEAVSVLFTGLSAKDKETLRQTPREDLIQYHFSWGMDIRNAFGLWAGNDALLKSVCGGAPCDPDDASMIIIAAVWEKVQNENPPPGGKK